MMMMKEVMMPKLEVTVFYNLILKATFYHFCYILLVIYTTPAYVAGNYIKISISGDGIVGGHLGGWLPQSDKRRSLSFCK